MKAILSAMALLSTFAFAGKADREFLKSNLNPAITAATAGVLQACGCSMKITVGKSIVNEADMKQAKYIVEEVSTGATKYCTDADSKAAVCKMKSLELAKGSESKFTFSGSHGVAMTDGQMNPSFDMITAQLDK